MPSRMMPRTAVITHTTSTAGFESIYQPYELERTAARAHPNVRSRSCAVSADPGGVVVTAELTSTDADAASVEVAIRLALAVDHGIDLHRVVITRPAVVTIA